MGWREIKEFSLDATKVIIFIVALLFVLQYVFSVTKVVGDSMFPTLHKEELFILNKFHYRFFDIKRGDSVSLEHKDTKYLIKRIIGLPGDTIQIKNSKLYINGSVYEENYLSDTLNYKDFDLKDIGYEKIPDDMYFVLGDNRENSLDSREIGLISKKDIQGKISFRFWPLNRMKFI